MGKKHKKYPRAVLVAPELQPTEGIFPSKCKEFESDGKKYIAVPLEVFRWIVCIPYGGKFVEKDGRRFPVPHVNSEKDWSLDIDMFFEGKPIGPFYKCEILLHRDDPSTMPKVKVELNG